MTMGDIRLAIDWTHPRQDQVQGRPPGGITGDLRIDDVNGQISLRSADQLPLGTIEVTTTRGEYTSPCRRAPLPLERTDPPRRHPGRQGIRRGAHQRGPDRHRFRGGGQRRPTGRDLRLGRHRVPPGLGTCDSRAAGGNQATKKTDTPKPPAKPATPKTPAP